MAVIAAWLIAAVILAAVGSLYEQSLTGILLWFGALFCIGMAGWHLGVWRRG